MAKKRKYAPKEIAAVIIKARDLMNHGGAHWIKHDEKVFNDELGAHQYCMLGAVREVTKNKPSLESQTLTALALGIDPKSDTDWEYDFDGNIVPVHFQPEEFVDDVISNFNDGHYTTWKDVRKKMTTVAKNLNRRKQ